MTYDDVFVGGVGLLDANYLTIFQCSLCVPSMGFGVMWSLQCYLAIVGDHYAKHIVWLKYSDPFAIGDSVFQCFLGCVVLGSVHGSDFRRWLDCWLVARYLRRSQGLDCLIHLGLV